MTEDLAARIADAEAIASDPTLPPNLRVAARKALEWLKEYRDRPESREELLWTRDNKLPAYVRDSDLIPRLIASGAVTDDGSGVVAVSGT